MRYIAYDTFRNVNPVTVYEPIGLLANAAFQLEYLRIPESERRACCDRRWVQARETTSEMTSEDHDRFVSLCQPPSANELSGGPIPQPPAEFESWPQWASHRWPTLHRLDL